MISIGIVDDHQSIREAYKKAIEESEEFCVIGSLSCADLADLWCRKFHPDIILMDICTEKGSSGLEATGRIKKNCPKTKVIVMTGFEEVSYISKAKQAGADAFIYKSRSFDYLLSLMHRVLKGEQVFPSPPKIPVLRGEGPITEREMEILRLLCNNYSRQEIAEILYISESTVKRHLRNMMEKTGMKSSVSLAVYIVSGGWINPNF